MRSLISREKQHNEKKMSNMVLGIILVIIMLFSIAGYGFYSASDNSQDEQEINSVKINNFVFYDYQGYWQTEISGINFGFKNLPNETGKIKIDSNFNKTINNYVNMPVYFVSENNEFKNEIALNLQSLVLRIQDACLEKCENEQENLPKKNCSDNLIIFNETNEKLINQKNNCVFIQGPLNESIKLADEFLYQILNIK